MLSSDYGFHLGGTLLDAHCAADALILLSATGCNTSILSYYHALILNLVAVFCLRLLDHQPADLENRSFFSSCSTSSLESVP